MTSLSFFCPWTSIDHTALIPYGANLLVSSHAGVRSALLPPQVLAAAQAFNGKLPYELALMGTRISIIPEIFMSPLLALLSLAGLRKLFANVVSLTR